MAEAGVVVEIQPQPCRVHENELARGTNLELRFRGNDLLAQRRQLLQRALHRRILDGIELDRAECAVIGVDEGAPGAADV